MTGESIEASQNLYACWRKRRAQDTFRYHIKAISVSTTDNTPEPLFNQLLSEFTADSTTLQLDVIQLGKQAYLIGGPVSYLFTCVTY
ncbi:hypothetical protein DDT52_13995 [Brenneria roseae subsp. roseae]|uniref:FidL-like protein n=1 Tax=Brenneria roseae TaxID=1509241 RepID=UPI000D60581E|nr:hypothetical protein DDT52_13995 [Brenneria roseae subsp. roseae]